MLRQSFSTAIKNKLFKRSKGICEVCRVNKASEIHHIVPASDGGKNNISNLTYLCGYCHEWAPGSYLDGYKDEFDIYTRNGGPCFGTIAWAYWMGWNEGKRNIDGNHLDCKKKFRELIQLLIKNNKGNPIRIGMCMEVFD